MRSLLLAVRRWNRGQPRLGRRRVLRLLRVGMMSTEVWLGLAALGWIVVVMGLLSQNAAVGLGLMVTSPVIMPMIAFAMVFARGVLGLGGRMPGWVILQMLADGRCPRCGYEIGGVPADGDGCAVCPECGAAWQWTAIGDRISDVPEVITLR